MYRIIKEFVEQTIMYILTGKYKLNRTTHFDEEITTFSLEDHVNTYIYNIAHILIIKNRPGILIKNYEYSNNNDFAYLTNVIPIIKFMDLDSQISLDTEYHNLSVEISNEIKNLPYKLQHKIRKKCTYITMKNINVRLTEHLNCKEINLSKQDTKLLAHIIMYKL